MAPYPDTSSAMITVLAPIDFSDATTPVISAAASLSRALAGRLVLLHVTPPPYIVSDDIGTAETIVALAKAAEKSAIRRLAHLQRKLQEEGITALTRHHSGSPVLGIIGEASSLPADYIVIGSHGHGAFYELLIGSTATGILKKASCPVVVVPVRPEKKRKKTAKK
jgi:universal stress protein A